MLKSESFQLKLFAFRPLGLKVTAEFLAIGKLDVLEPGRRLKPIEKTLLESSTQFKQRQGKLSGS